MATAHLQEKANYTRLCRLLVDKGTEALRNALHTVHPPSNLPTVLNANQTRLLKLKPRVINNSQWNLLFPPFGNPPDSKTFDITLLSILLRNICTLPSPATGWDSLPPAADSSLQANVTRIKIFRNEIYAHVASLQVEKATFDQLWQNISEALLALNIPKQEIDDLEKCPLSPEEEIYAQSLEKWYSEEENSKQLLRNLERHLYEHGTAIQHLTQKADENREGIQQLIKIQVDGKQTNNADVQQLRTLAKHNFNSKIERNVKLFHPGTRDWLIKKIESWFTTENESRLLVLTAGPGFGKSVFASKICQIFKQKGKFAACHFCNFGDSNLKAPMAMLQSLASQMCDNVDGFQEKLLDQLHRPHKVCNLKDAFQIYLQNPLDELEVGHSLIVIDGLDEGATDERSEMMTLIADHFPDLPECVRVLVTSRPELFLRKFDHIPIINVDTNLWENKLDLIEYLKVHLPSLVRGDSYPYMKKIRIVVEKCEGSFLYAQHIQRELCKRKDLDTMQSYDIMAFLPKGIGSVYESYFCRLEMELEAVLNRNPELFKLLELIVAAEGPLPLTFLVRALDLDSDCREMRRIINKVNEVVSCLLYVSSDDLVTVFHRSVYDWLCFESHEYTVKVTEGKKRLWLSCKQIFEEIKKIVMSRGELELTSEVKHTLKFGHKYLVACNIKEDFSWLVDMIIVHVILTIHPKTIVYLIDVMYMVHQNDVGLSLQLRQKISWHLVEVFRLNMDPCFSYLHCVMSCSPVGCFSKKEKEVAEMLLAKSFGCLQANSLGTKTANLIQARLFRRNKVQVVSASSNKKVVAVALQDGIIRVLSLPELVILWQHSTEYDDISCCTFAPDDSFILYGKLETVLNIAEKREVSFFDGTEERFQSCAFSTNGKRLVTNNGSSTVKLWDVVRQSLLSVLCAGVPVGVCSFSNSGLFIIGDQKNANEAPYCVWSAITLQRIDQRRLRPPPSNLHKAHSKVCNRCVWPQRKELIPSKELGSLASLQLSFLNRKYKEVVYSKLSTGVYHGEDCIFYLGRHSLRVIECTHLTTIAAWETYIQYPCITYGDPSNSITIVNFASINDDSWLYADARRIVVVSTVSQEEDQPRLSPVTHVLWCAFSPDETRLATCTSNGFVNLWDIDKCNVYQRFMSNIGTSPAACWWSSRYLFVCHVTCGIPILSKYLVEENYRITISQGQPRSLTTFVVKECLPVSKVVDFSEGYLSFMRGAWKPVIVLDVKKTGYPKVVDLPRMLPMMIIAVSVGATFILGTNLPNYLLWKRSESNPAVYNFLRGFVICNPSPISHNYFSNDSKVVHSLVIGRQCFIAMCVDTGVGKEGMFDFDCVGLNTPLVGKVFCTNKFIITITEQVIQFFDSKSLKFLGFSFQRHLSDDLVIASRISRKRNVLAVPRLTGDIDFFRIRPPETGVSKEF